MDTKQTFIANATKPSPLFGRSSFDAPFGRDFTKKFNPADMVQSPETPVQPAPRTRMPTIDDLNKVRK